MTKKKKLNYEEICLYCKGYNLSKQEYKRKHVDEKKDPERLSAKVKPQSKPEDQKCKSFRMSEDAKFCFDEENKGINDKLPTPWSDYRRNQLQKIYQKALGII